MSYISYIIIREGGKYRCILSLSSLVMPYVLSRYKSLAVMSVHCYRSSLEMWSQFTNNTTFAHKHHWHTFCLVWFSAGMAVVHFCFSINLNTGLSPPNLLCLAGCCHSVCKVWRWFQFEQSQYVVECACLSFWWAADTIYWNDFGILSLFQMFWTCFPSPPPHLFFALCH